MLGTEQVANSSPGCVRYISYPMFIEPMITWGSSIYYVINFLTIFNPPPLVIKRHQAPNPPPPNITSSVNMLISILRCTSNCCKIRYINECLPTERKELKQTVNNAII